MIPIIWLSSAVVQGCDPKCGNNSYCVEDDFFPYCSCSSGYTGNGDNCTGLICIYMYFFVFSVLFDHRFVNFIVIIPTYFIYQ